MNTTKRTVKAILSALSAEGGMALVQLLCWGSLALFGLVNLVISPYSEIGMFAGFATEFPKLSICLLVIGVPSTLFIGMFAYLYGLRDMVSQFRNSMDISTVFEITGDEVTIKNDQEDWIDAEAKGGRKIKQAIKNILGMMMVTVMAIGCGVSEETMCLYTHDVTTIAIETKDVDYNGDPIGHRAASMCNQCKVVRTYKNHTVEIQNDVCVVKCVKQEGNK